MSFASREQNYSNSDSSITVMPISENPPEGWNFGIAGQSDRTGEEMIGLGHYRSKHTGEVIYPLWGILLNDAPLAAKVTYEDGVCFASINSLDTFGDGDTPEEALHVLIEHVLNHIDFYKEQEESVLSDFAKSKREQFINILVERE